MSGPLVDGGGHRQPHFFAHVTTASSMTGNATIGHNYRSTGSYNVRASQEICHSPPDAHPSKVRCGEKKLKMANVELHFKAELKCITNSLLARSFEVHWPWAASSVAVDSLVMPNSDLRSPSLPCNPNLGEVRPNLYNCHLEKYDFAPLGDK